MNVIGLRREVVPGRVEEVRRRIDRLARFLEPGDGAGQRLKLAQSGTAHSIQVQHQSLDAIVVRRPFDGVQKVLQPRLDLLGPQHPGDGQLLRVAGDLFDDRTARIQNQCAPIGNPGSVVVQDPRDHHDEDHEEEQIHRNSSSSVHPGPTDPARSPPASFFFSPFRTPSGPPIRWRRVELYRDPGPSPDLDQTPSFTI